MPVGSEYLRIFVYLYEGTSVFNEGLLVGFNHCPSVYVYDWKQSIVNNLAFIEINQTTTPPLLNGTYYIGFDCLLAQKYSVYVCLVSGCLPPGYSDITNNVSYSQDKGSSSSNEQYVILTLLFLSFLL